MKAAEKTCSLNTRCLRRAIEARTPMSDLGNWSNPTTCTAFANAHSPLFGSIAGPRKELDYHRRASRGGTRLLRSQRRLLALTTAAWRGAASLAGEPEKSTAPKNY
eukprot:190732-Chlamydomonas_euryale.AAC.16